MAETVTGSGAGWNGASIRIGGVDFEREQAKAAAAQYVARRGHRFGYPAYDAFDSGSGLFRVADGDFLAPVLLNVPVTIKTFYSLSDLREPLENWLQRVPADARLVDAGPAELDLLGELFAVLDGPARRPHIRGSVLATVMHRKRPAFVPLYDRHVDYCYRGAPEAPIARDTKRPWAEFVQLLGAAMIEDLRRESSYLGAVVAMASEPPITALRALDIVAWQVGRKTGPKPGLWSDDQIHEEFDDSDEDLADLEDAV